MLTENMTAIVVESLRYVAHGPLVSIGKWYWLHTESSVLKNGVEKSFQHHLPKHQKPKHIYGLITLLAHVISTTIVCNRAT